jgi:tRNA1(Val) A37 N6-methylase TrmN6
MEHLQNGYTLDTPGGTFPLSTDSMLLADFIRLPRDASVLDFGAGCGTLGLLLCAKDAGCAVTGIELTEDAHTAALENIRRNGLQQRLQSIQGDLRTYAGGPFDCCVSNPPYFSGGPASRQTPLARREDLCNPEELFAAASRNLKYGGDFFLVHKPERLAQLIATGAKYNLEAKRLCLVRHREGAPVNLILLQLRKGAKPGLTWEEIALQNPDGSPTPVYREIYHI